MKIKINTVLSALQVMARLAGERHSVQFAYRIQRIYSKLLSEAKRVDSLRKEMQLRYGMDTQKDGSIGFPPITTQDEELAKKQTAENADKMKAAEKEWTEFCEGETEVDCWVLPMSLLNKENEVAEKQHNIQPIAISAGDLIALGPIFDPEQPEGSEIEKSAESTPVEGADVAPNPRQKGVRP